MARGISTTGASLVRRQSRAKIETLFAHLKRIQTSAVCGFEVLPKLNPSSALSM